MSFTFKSAEENFISAVPGKVADVYYNDYYESVKGELEHLNNFFPFQLSAPAKEYINERGIRLSPHASVTHPHPISKIFENHMLYNVLPRFIEEGSRLAIFSMKESKAEYLYFRAKDFELSTLNRFITAQDSGRYSNKTIVPGGKGNFNLFVSNVLHRFRKLMPDLIFFHDELMHWGLNDFAYFIGKIEPKTLAFTYVYPPELLAGVSRSCNSLAYTFEKIDGDLFVFPDGRKTCPYQHIKSEDWPFRINKFVVKTVFGDRHFSLDLVESHGAHHFFVLKAGDLVTQKRRFFNDFDCLCLSKVVLRSSKKPLSGVVRYSLISKVLNYLVCLKKKDVESALAKLRQLTEGKLLKDELLIIHDLAEVLSKYNMSIDEPSFIDWLNVFKLRQNLRLDSPLLNFIFGDSEILIKNRIRELASSIKPFSFNIECHEFTYSLARSKGSKSQAPDSKFGKIKEFASSLSPFSSVKASSLITLEDQTPPVEQSLQDSSIHNIGLSLAVLPGSKIIRAKSKIPDIEPSIGIEEGIDILKSVVEPVEPSEASSSNSSGEREVSPEDLKPDSMQHNFPNQVNSDISRWLSEKRNGCFLTAVCSTIKTSPYAFINRLGQCAPEPGTALQSAIHKLESDLALTVPEMEALCTLFSWRVWIYMHDDIIKLNDDKSLRAIQIGGREGHVFVLKELSFFKTIGIIEKAYSKLFGNTPQITLYEPNLLKASNLLSSFSSMMIGALIDKRVVEGGGILRKEVLRDVRKKTLLTRDREVKIVPFLGFAGSGKTSTLFDELNSSFLLIPFLWISPRRKVLDELISKLDLGYEKDKNVAFKKNFITFEKALLLNELPKLIIIDEAPLLPPGYLDLLLCKEGVSNDTSVALIGDVLQCKFHCNDHILMAKSKIDLFEVLASRNSLKIQTDYLMRSFRFGSFPLVSMVQTSEKEFRFLRLKEPSEDSNAILVASERDKRNAGGLTDDRVMTIGEAQGCTFEKVSLILTDDLNLSDIGTVVTGLTRASMSLEIVVDPAKASFFSSYKAGANNCNLIMTQNHVQLSNLCKPLLNGLTIHKFTMAGNDFELKLEGDPFLKSMLNMVPPLANSVVELEEISAQSAIPKTHLPLVECDPLGLDCFERIRAREFREFWVNGTGWSSQFEDTLLPKSESFLQVPCLNPQNIFPRHKADDSVTFWAAVKKRLFFSNPATQRRKFLESRASGKEILRCFLRHVPLDNSIDNAMMSEAISEFELKKISKSAALIANHSIRSDTDWDERNIFLFMKSQLCKKREKMFCDAKAGQTLACFAHSVLVKFSGVCRYIEKKLSISLPERFYVHQKKDFKEFEAWVIDRQFGGYCTESDYEAFDSSQDHIALAFEVALMEFLGFDIAVIEDYIFIKTHLYCKLGEFAIMRFTGEFCTFLFNTLVNMAFTFLKYDISKGVSIAFAGDDMCANQRLNPNPRKEELNLLDLMSLKAKVEFTRNPTFCGWYLSAYGIVKCPFLMCARLANSMYKDELKLVIDSYFLEFCFAYEKKDLLLEILCERDLEFHYLLTRFFVKKSHLLRGSAKEALMSTKENGKLMFGESTFGNDSFRSRTEKLIRGYKDKCLSLMSKNSSTSPADQVTRSSLMELSEVKFTAILGSSSPSVLMSSRDSKLTLPYLSTQTQGSSALMRHSLIKQRLKTFNPLVRSILCYTSQLYCCPLLDFSHQAQRLKENYSSLTEEVQKCQPHSRMGSCLIFKEAIGLTTYIAQITWCPLEIKAYTRASNLDLSFLECILRRGAMPFTLTLESCTDYSITLMKAWLGRLCGNQSSKNFSAVISCQTLKVKSAFLNSSLLTYSTLRMLVISKLYQMGETSWDQVKRGFLGCADTMLSQCRTILGWVKLILKERLLEIWAILKERLQQLQKFQSEKLTSGSKEMAARYLLQEQIRIGLKDYLWMNIVDPTNALNLTPAANAQLTQEQTNRKNLILDHFLKNLFGNIAVEGASDKVAFPNLDIRLTAIPAATLGLNEAHVVEHNIMTSVGAIKAWRDNHPNVAVRNLTLRGCCKPFADYAMDFLNEHPEVRTSLYDKQPHMCSRAPEVAFDFADGLSNNRIANNRDRQFVISSLASRTFNHEAKKGVFEAQGQVNFTFDG